MDLSSFTFEHGYSRNGSFAGKQSRAYLLSDINGFASDQFIAFHDEFFDVNGGSINYGSAATISLAAAEYQGLTGTTEFRLYFADNTVVATTFIDLMTCHSTAPSSLPFRNLAPTLLWRSIGSL